MDTGRTKKLSIKDFRDIVRRDIDVIKWPGTEKEVGLMLLNVGEIMDAHIDARAYFRKQAQDVDLFSQNELLREEEHQMIYRMIVDHACKVGKDRVFSSMDDVRKHLLPDEREYFIALHTKRFEKRSEEWDWPTDDVDGEKVNG